MLVTLSGMVMLVMLVKLLKTQDGIAVTPSGMTTLPLGCSPFRYITLFAETAEAIPSIDITSNHAAKSPLKSMRATLSVSLKTALPTLSKPAGIVTFCTPPQPENAPSPMLFTLSGIIILVSELQFWNALLPMLVTLSGIDMLVRLLQL